MTSTNRNSCAIEDLAHDFSVRRFAQKRVQKSPRGRQRMRPDLLEAPVENVLLEGEIGWEDSKVSCTLRKGSSVQADYVL